MDINKLEIELRKIFDNNELILDPKNYYFQIIDELENIINNIGKLNDALGDVTYTKDYYYDIFNNRRKMLEFILHCEDVEYVIERRIKELKSSFRHFLLNMYKDKEFYEILIEDFPNFEKLVNKIAKMESQNGENNNELDEEFRDYYNNFFTREKEK